MRKVISSSHTQPNTSLAYAPAESLRNSCIPEPVTAAGLIGFDALALGMVTRSATPKVAKRLATRSPDDRYCVDDVPTVQLLPPRFLQFFPVRSSTAS